MYDLSYIFTVFPNVPLRPGMLCAGEDRKYLYTSEITFF